MRRRDLFRFIPEAVHSAVEHLELLGAVEKREGQVFLSALGKKMASFPLEPRYAKVNTFWEMHSITQIDSDKVVGF